MRYTLKITALGLLIAVMVLPVQRLFAQTPGAAAEAVRIEAEYDAIDDRLFAMRSFIDEADGVGGTLISLARALEEADAMEGKLGSLRVRLNALRAGDAQQEEDENDLEGDSENKENEDEAWGSFLDTLKKPDIGNTGLVETGGADISSIPASGDEAVTEPDFDGVQQEGAEAQPVAGDANDWDALEADAQANPSEYEYVGGEVDQTGSTDSQGGAESDDWDNIDEIDDQLVGVDQNRINAMRDKMAQQADNDKNRISANAHQEYSQVQAERRRAREEYLRRQAQQRAALAASLQAFANQMNSENLPASPLPPRSSSPVSRSSGSSSGGGGMTNAQYQRLLKRCMDAKYAKARNSGFPIMDPNGPRIECDAAIRNGSSGNGSSTGKGRSSRGGTITRKTTANAKLNTWYKSGGSGVHTFIFPGIPPQGAKLRVMWTMYMEPDRIAVYYDGRVVFDSGVVNTSSSKTLPPFYGSSLKIVLTGSNNATNWEYYLEQG